jgi:hypothetical protein
MWNENWIKGEDYPAWGDTDVYKKTISGGYLYYDETPKEAYERVAKTVARRLYKPEMAYLLAVLVLTLLIAYRISVKKI